MKKLKWFTTVGNNYVECATWKVLGKVGDQKLEKKLSKKGYVWKW